MDAAHQPGGKGQPAPKREFPIFIDREQFKVDQDHMTGAELRALPAPPIGDDRVLYQVVPGSGDDILVADDLTVDLKPGMHFVTAPKAINAGASHGGH